MINELIKSGAITVVVRGTWFSFYVIMEIIADSCSYLTFAHALHLYLGYFNASTVVVV